MFARQDPLPLQDSQRNELALLIANRYTPQAAVLRAKIVLMAADGKSSGTIANELQTSRPTVQKWKSRFACLGIPGIMEDAKRSGRPPKLGPDEVKEYIAATILTKPSDGGRWTVRTFAQEHGLNRNTVQRLWASNGVQPDGRKRYTRSNPSRACDSLGDTGERSHMSVDCESSPMAEPDSAVVAAEKPDTANRENSSNTRPDDCTRDRIPKPVLECLDDVNAIVLSLYSNGEFCQNQIGVNRALAALVKAIEDSNPSSGSEPESGDSDQVSEPSSRPGKRFQEYLGALRDVVGHADRHKPLESYLMGLLISGERKSVEPMAARVAPTRVRAMHNSMHHFVSTAPWDGQRLIDTARDYALEHFARHGGVEVWIVDDTGIPKKGNMSVGVARQYCGVLGKTANCQVAVSVSLANAAQSLPVAYQLYLPEQWAESPERRERAGVPPEIEFKTKWQIAVDEIKRLCADGVQRGIILADAGYGDATEFREELTGMGLQYSVGIKSGTTLWPPGMQPVAPIQHCGRGRRSKLLRRTPEHRPVSALELARSLPKDAWVQVHWRDGTSGAMESRFAAVRVRCAHRDEQRTTPRDVEWMLVEWPERESEPTKYWLSTLCETTTIVELVRRTKDRWHIERDYQDMKEELGLDHYEGRNWRGFHHHGALCMAAYAFLCAERCRLSPPGDRDLFEIIPLPEGWRQRGSPGQTRTT